VENSDLPRQVMRVREGLEEEEEGGDVEEGQAEAGRESGLEVRTTMYVECLWVYARQYLYNY